MASFRDWTKRPEAQKVKSPPFCWVIFGAKGEEVFAPNKKLPIFMEWQNAQNFIESRKLEGCKSKILYWHEVVKKVKKIVREIILDLGNGCYVFFPPEL